jgi:OOP family OmpA-OmpF porin
MALGVPSMAQSSVVTVPPPQVQDYWVSISRQPGGTLVFDGFAPDAVVRDQLGQHDGADISWLKLGSGAPEGYGAATAFGLDILDHLSEGRFALRGSVLTVNGIADSQADFLSLRDTLASKVPAGLILAKAEIAAPRVESYTFSLRRQPNGNVLLSGFLPNPEFEQRLLLLVGARSSSTARFGSGEPVNFVAELDRVMPLFALLQDGEVKLENGAWLFSGTPKSAADADSIRAAFSTDRLAEAGWSFALAAPAPSTAAVAEAPTPSATAPAPELAPPVAPAATPSQQNPSPAPSVEAAAPQPAAEVAAPAVAAPAAQAADNIALCRSQLADLSAQNGILFRSGAAVLAEGADVVLQAIAGVASQCPSAAIDVAGHTDSDGEAAANLALSVARAEAVVAALIKLGVGPERLYAIGYGETEPVADNSTAAGKAQNRRIVVSVRDGA